LSVDNDRIKSFLIGSNGRAREIRAGLDPNAEFLQDVKQYMGCRLVRTN
jgi:hypothetical protein